MVSGSVSVVVTSFYWFSAIPATTHCLPLFLMSFSVVLVCSTFVKLI